ncbi:MAG: S8 family serine peptidase [Actinobacteria bacterium]|nr:S8 family serine peptidase [Actinomycetota bacterium]
MTFVAALAVLAGLVPVPAAHAQGDPLRGRQWGLEQVRAPGAWERSTGAGTTIAIVDSGIDLGHPDLVANVVAGVTYSGCADDFDGCGNGDYRSGEEPPFSGHGTHVAGIAAALAGNDVGIAGVAPDARLLSVKVLHREDDQVVGNTAEIAAGIRWATRNGADVINLSLNAGPHSPLISITGGFEPVRDAVSEATAAGVVVVAAAGNDASVVCGEPAFDPQVVCVVATDRFEQRAPYSNLAVQPGFNVVAAPGGLNSPVCEEDIASTYPAGHQSVCELPRDYEYLAGTSMAAPHVAGVAALLLAQGRSARDTIDILKRTARTPGSGARGSYTVTYGYGIVDAEAATAEPLDAPRIVERHAGDDRIATAAAVSRATWARADVVTIATAFEYADALAGAPLASHLDGPLLLSHRDGLSDATATEVERLQARDAVLLGGPAALSEQVADDLRAMGVRVQRLGGANRFETAAQIAFNLPDSDEVFIAQGIDTDPNRGWPDALSASGLAAAEVKPVLLVRSDQLPPETAGQLSPDVDATIVGGPASVSQSVAAAIDARAGTVRRLAGEDRYATSVDVAREAERRRVPDTTIWVATGRAFADGLVAGAAAGSTPGLFVLIDGQGLEGSPISRAFIEEQEGAVRHLRIAGGVAAVTRAVEDHLRDLVGER